MIDFKLFGGFGNGLTDRLTDERTDIGGCRVAFATENCKYFEGHGPINTGCSIMKVPKVGLC